MKIKYYLGVALAGLIAGCGSNAQTNQKVDDGFIIQLRNPMVKNRNEMVVLSDPNLFVNSLAPGAVTIKSNAAELVDVDGDSKADRLIMNLDLSAEASLSMAWPTDIEREVMPVKKTQAEISHKVGGEWQGRKYIGGEFLNVDYLRVPDEHTDHSYFIRYEGPGLENDLIGYRFYLDWRNAMDIFGKRVDTLVLQVVGQDGFDSYHENAPWGMDILKAGKSLGIGAIGQYIDGKVEHFKQTDSVTCEIVADGLLSAAVETKYYGWQTSNKTCNLTSLMTIEVGDRSVCHQLTFDHPIEDFCTGIVKHDSATSFTSLVGSSGWAYLATYGKQSLSNDKLGLAIFYNTKDVSEVLDSSYDHLIVFKPVDTLSYYLLGAWEQEENGVGSMEEFQQYLDDKLVRLNQPIEITIN
ncbi:DUF4861 domain-containing protein [Reichenbachiella carrageenanivorans]|uniref:DUF4861 domain-containing protein n=1 Tax=Reichenbachiella carrageenanivorans TaxID=2979869 RepID=A0ABY6CUJ7_9BACT|nr:DUF4861 domain-containing protein [Reichenbachiella carrageenanivorans]UXX77609.1 DUF4861 domain-containing protein [Reichenbachiella carrageenanivorans]